MSQQPPRKDSTRIRAELQTQLTAAHALQRTNPVRADAIIAELLPQYLDAVMVEAGDHPDEWDEELYGPGPLPADDEETPG